jgi:2-polyprenyl-3-methyl-5-hydroxy-6-metoxy-1,4-benzoquinol methylase
LPNFLYSAKKTSNVYFKLYTEKKQMNEIAREGHSVPHSSDSALSSAATPSTLPSISSLEPYTYPDFANPDLLDRIPLTARTVLDVGCAQGALGEAYLRRNPNARVLGIDADSQAASQARQRLSEVACLDVEAVPMPFEVSNGIDCIIYGDVLEHMKDPWRLLASQANHLAPGGTVLVCMPNVEHWRFALRLLNGSFDYEPNGLLDRTHLRWFTPRSMARALQDAGLELADLFPRPIATEDAQRFALAMAPGLQAIGVDPREYLNRAGPLQFIWRARRAAPPRIMLHAAALPPLGGVSEVRIMQPMRAMQTDSAILAMIQDEEDISKTQNNLPDMPRIAVLHRPLLVGEPGIARIKKLLANNYLIVTEFDDHPNFMTERGVDLNDVLTFKAVHAIQTSTAALADVLRPANPEIAVFPNAILALPDLCNFENPERLTLFFGALNRSADWEPLMPVLNEIAQVVGPRLNFSVIHDRVFFEALQTPHKHFIPTCDYPTYLNRLSRAEIALMPLADTAFNRAKSDLKFIEAGASRVVALASTVVYGNVVQGGITGMLFEDAKQLRVCLLRLLAYPDSARRMADAARQYVAQDRMLAYQVAQRSDWYRSLWQRREPLTAALQARVPAVFS